MSAYRTPGYIASLSVGVLTAAGLEEPHWHVLQVAILRLDRSLTGTRISKREFIYNEIPDAYILSEGCSNYIRIMFRRPESQAMSRLVLGSALGKPERACAQDLERE